MAAKPVSSPQSALSRLLESGRFSDLTLVCRGKEFLVHKNIICEQSKVFNAAVTGNFQEAQTKRINVDFDQEICGYMVKYMYTNTYNVILAKKGEFVKTGPNGADEASVKQPQVQRQVIAANKVLAHVRVYAIADYYAIDGLQKLSVKEVEKMLAEEWNADAFMEAAREAAAITTDRTLAEVLGAAAAKHSQDLVSRKDLGSIAWLGHAPFVGALAVCQKMQAEINVLAEEIKMMKSLHRQLQEMRPCRNIRCGEVPNGYIDERFVLRCRKCQRTHVNE